jgi:hypothetical protein
VALRARVSGAARLARSRAALGLLVWLGLGVLGVLHLWFVLFAAGVEPKVFAGSATMLLCLLGALAAQWAAEIVAMIGAFRIARRF